MEAAAAARPEAEMQERVGLTTGQPVPNATWNRVRRVGNVILVTGLVATVGAFGFKHNNGAWVLGLSLLGAAELFGLARLNIETAQRRFAVYIVANIIYELFLPFYTAAGANPENKVLPYFPVAVLMLGTICLLEYFSKTVTDTHKQIVERDSDITPHPSNERFFGFYPMTSEPIKYAAVQLLPIAGGIACTVVGSKTSGYPSYLLLSSGYRLLAGGGGAVIKNIFANILEASKQSERMRSYSCKTVSMMAFNNFMTGIAKVAAPLAYAAARISGKLPAMTAAGFLEGWQREEAQRMLETYGRNPPNATAENKTPIRIAIVAFSILFGAIATGYTVAVARKEHNSATWDATEGMLGSLVGSFLASVGTQLLWRNPAEHGAVLWLIRLFFAEYPNWIGYLAADFDHARRMANVTDPMIIAALCQTTGTIGLDLSRGLDFMRVYQGVSPFGMIALSGFAELVPSIIPVPSNSTGG